MAVAVGAKNASPLRPTDSDSVCASEHVAGTAMWCIHIWPVIARWHCVQDVTCHVRVLHDYSSRIQSPLHEEQNAISQEPKQQPLSVIRTVGVSLRPTGETLAVRRSFQGGTDDKHD